MFADISGEYCEGVNVGAKWKGLIIEVKGVKILLSAMTSEGSLF